MDRRQAKIKIIVDDHVISEIPMTEDNANWMKAKRLREKGTPEALAELKRMENTEMVIIDADDLSS